MNSQPNLESSIDQMLSVSKYSNRSSIEILTENTCKFDIDLLSYFDRKIAPQNIMYDRRIVRGNTFAALVIPVNMQPESMTTAKKPK